MNKWLIAVLPPSNISIEILAIQKEIEREFGAVHAQKVPPHITIIPPFEAEESKVETLLETIQKKLLDKLRQSIQLKLDNFQRFEARTLFIDVAKNEPFERFCKELKLLFYHEKLNKRKAEKHFFVPHITLANKDLMKKDFEKAWDTFKTEEYQRSFELKKLSLLKLDESKWVKATELYL